MKKAEWLKTFLPETAKRLYEELLRLDPVPEEYASTPVVAAAYHLSRHTRSLKVESDNGIGKLPEPCKEPPFRCKAFGVARALLACQLGAPGVGGEVVRRYADEARAARLALGKILKRLSPATKELVSLLRPQSAGLLQEVRDVLVAAVSVHDDLIRCGKDLEKLGKRPSSGTLGDDAPGIRGKKRDLDHLDRITEPLLGCYVDKEIVELVPDGGPLGEGGEQAISRVSNRRQKLTGARKGGRPGNPGRPRKTPRKT